MTAAFRHALAAIKAGERPQLPAARLRRSPAAEGTPTVQVA
ncbi:hypothetical protein ACFYMW_31210 [Streptomyces sp. NPDC006692]